MGLYEQIKDIAKIVQQADNVDLYLRLLNLGATALDMQEKIAKIKEENNKLKEQLSLQNKVIRHDSLYITLKDNESIFYCAHCWDSSKQLIQVECNDYNGSFKCPHCKIEGIYNKEAYAEAENKLGETFKQLNSRNSRKKWLDAY
jgi:phage FluMu protein Com